MAKSVNLNEEQKKLVHTALEASNSATTQAQTAIESANSKRKVLDDLITMFCISNGLVKEKTKIDLVSGVAYEED